jgi:hypothetical protein
MKKQQKYAANVTHASLQFLYEAGTLHEIAGFVARHQCSEESSECSDDRIQFLNNMVGERISMAFEGLHIVDDYFQKRGGKKNNQGKARELGEVTAERIKNPDLSLTTR